VRRTGATVADETSEGLLSSYLKWIPAARNKLPFITPDYRELLDDKDIDAVVIATPDHWHGFQTIEACQAGKYVLVEFPTSHFVDEGRAMIKAAIRFDRVVGTAIPHRVNPGMQELVKYIHSGKLGKVHLARAISYNFRPSLGDVSPVAPVPASFDFNIWMGPAPAAPYRPKRVANWRYYYKTGSGDLGDEGANLLDICRWALNEESVPYAATNVGGRFGYSDDAELPNTQTALFGYTDAPILIETRGLPLEKEYQAPLSKWQNNLPSYTHHQTIKNGVVVYCDKGDVVITTQTGGIVYDKDGGEIERFISPEEDQLEQFVEHCFNSISPAGWNIEEGHYSSSLAHMGNASYRLGSPFANLNDSRRELQEAVKRMQIHLKRNEVDLCVTPLLQGPTLQIDQETETVVQNQEARSLLRPRYRVGFKLPE
jgi:predicted dehydrogenase